MIENGGKPVAAKSASIHARLPASCTHFASSSSLNCFVALAPFRWHCARSHPTSHLRAAQKVQDHAGVQSVCEQVPDRQSVLSPSRLLSCLRSRDLLLWLRFLAVLEPGSSRLCHVATSSTLCYVCVLHPFEVLPCAAVTRSELVKACCQTFWRALHHSIRPLARGQPVLLSFDSLFIQAPCFGRILLCDLPLQVR